MNRQGRSKSTGRRVNDIGATLVEYALIVALVAVGSIAAINFLQTASSDEVANQADCVSTRPPPASCQAAPIITTTTASTVPTTATTAPPTTPTTAATTTSTVPPNTSTWTGVATSIDADFWYAEATLDVRTAGSSPVEGAVVRVRWRLTNPVYPDQFTTECTTTAAGTCTVRFDVPYAGVLQIEARVLTIDSTPPVATLPSPLTYSKPS
jgi:Flp pilus assembly pilin Flp